MLHAALVTAGLTAATAREPQVIVDLVGLEFIDCSGITVLARGRKLAQQAFDLEFSQTVKWDGDQGIEILAFWDTALQAQQIGLA
jgi:hypothetical protein